MNGLAQLSPSVRNTLRTVQALVGPLSDTPYKADFIRHLENQDIVSLTSLPFPPIGDDVLEFADDYLLYNLLRKVEGDIGVDTRAAAISKFWDSEQQCRATNHRFQLYNSGLLCATRPVERVLHSARKRIAKLLRGIPYKHIADKVRFGPGTSSSCKGDTSIFKKAGSTLHVTSNALPLARLLLSNDLALSNAATGLNGEGFYSSLDFVVVEQNKVTTVPKNAKTDRCIATEPHMNMWVQLGVGDAIRSKLKSVGINLDDQTRNQFLAATAVEKGLATIDLAAASDTIAYRVVADLLPLGWFCLLDVLRSPKGMVDGVEVVYEKFSSMGNGYTFELETLIFWSVSMAVCDELALETHDVSVYGDDIILPSKAVPLLSEVFSFLGFTINQEKSYAEGPFRESCGKHYFYGIDVSPFFIREFISKEGGVRPYYKLANAIRYYAARVGSVDRCDRRFFRIWNDIRRRIPKNLRFIIPPGYADDSGIVVSSGECQTNGYSGVVRVWSVRYQHDFLKFKYLRTKLTKSRYVGNDWARLYASLSMVGGEESASTDGYTHRKSRSRDVVAPGLVRDWGVMPAW